MCIKKENLFKNSSIKTNINVLHNNMLRKKYLSGQISEIKTKIDLTKMKKKFDIKNQINSLKMKKEFFSIFKLYLQIKNFTNEDSLKIINKKLLQKQKKLKELEKSEKKVINKIIKNTKKINFKKNKHKVLLKKVLLLNK